MRISRRVALRVTAGIFLLPSLTACPVSLAGNYAELISDALDVTWRSIVAQTPGLTISSESQAALTNAFRTLHLGAWELTTSAAVAPASVEEFVKGVNEIISVIVGTPAIALSLPGPTGDPVSAVLAAVVTLMPEVERSFKFTIPIASIERPAPGAPPPPPVRKPPMREDAAEELLERVAATRKQPPPR